jgi:hypothetical protein
VSERFVFELYDPVYFVLEYGDIEQWGLTPPMPRYAAEYLLGDFAAGVPYEGKRVTRADMVPWEPWQ